MRVYSSNLFRHLSFSPARVCIHALIPLILKGMYVILLTSDAGSQYRCGLVGRGIQTPSDKHAKSIQNARFFSFRLVFTDGRTDKASYRVACPQQKKRWVL